jgi:hypothetical protein
MMAKPTPDGASLEGTDAGAVFDLGAADENADIGDRPFESAVSSSSQLSGMGGAAGKSTFNLADSDDPDMDPDDGGRPEPVDDGSGGDTDVGTDARPPVFDVPEAQLKTLLNAEFTLAEIEEMSPSMRDRMVQRFSAAAETGQPAAKTEEDDGILSALDDDERAAVERLIKRELGGLQGRLQTAEAAAQQFAIQQARQDLSMRYPDVKDDAEWAKVQEKAAELADDVAAGRRSGFESYDALFRHAAGDVYAGKASTERARVAAKAERAKRQSTPTPGSGGVKPHAKAKSVDDMETEALRHIMSGDYDVQSIRRKIGL